MRIYIVLLIDAYVPYVKLATTDEQEALDKAKELADGWNNEVHGDIEEIYFNQAKSGDMADAVSVQKIDAHVELDAP